MTFFLFTQYHYSTCDECVFAIAIEVKCRISMQRMLHHSLFVLSTTFSHFLRLSILWCRCIWCHVGIVKSIHFEFWLHFSNSLRMALFSLLLVFFFFLFVWKIWYTMTMSWVYNNFIRKNETRSKSRYFYHILHGSIRGNDDTIVISKYYCRLA